MSLFDAYKKHKVKSYKCMSQVLMFMNIFTLKHFADLVGFSVVGSERCDLISGLFWVLDGSFLFSLYLKPEQLSSEPSLHELL